MWGRNAYILASKKLTNAIVYQAAAHRKGLHKAGFGNVGVRVPSLVGKAWFSSYLPGPTIVRIIQKRFGKPNHWGQFGKCQVRCKSLVVEAWFSKLPARANYNPNNLIKAGQTKSPGPVLEMSNEV